MENINKSNKIIFETNAQCCDIRNEIIDKEQEDMEEDIEIKFEDMISLDYKDIDENKHELILPKDYEIIIEGNKPILVKKKLKYPTTYKECFNICFGNKHHIVQVVGLDGLGNNKELFEKFIKLKICRDAYWKIAGDEMGLGKPWEPVFLNPTKEIRYFIFCTGITIEKGQSLFPSNKVLIFPAAEMRDAFYENFKELINKTKELL